MVKSTVKPLLLIRAPQFSGRLDSRNDPAAVAAVLEMLEAALEHAASINAVPVLVGRLSVRGLDMDTLVSLTNRLYGRGAIYIQLHDRNGLLEVKRQETVRVLCAARVIEIADTQGYKLGGWELEGEKQVSLKSGAHQILLSGDGAIIPEPFDVHCKDPEFGLYKVSPSGKVSIFKLPRHPLLMQSVDDEAPAEAGAKASSSVFARMLEQQIANSEEEEESVESALQDVLSELDASAPVRRAIEQLLEDVPEDLSP